MTMEDYIGSPVPMNSIRNMADELTNKVLAKINCSQELVLMNDYVQENNEFLIKKCFQNRISEINAWRWVLEDLTKRIEETCSTLRHERKAINVVLERIAGEIMTKSKKSSGVGALAAAYKTDIVEESMRQELAFLRGQKKVFQELKEVTEKQIKRNEAVQKRIEHDIFKKVEAITVEESCSSIDSKSVEKVANRKKKRRSSVLTWQQRCAKIKQDGLNCLYHTNLTRQQVRGARVQLSISAQSYANIVDTALRKRYHANKLKLQEIDWHMDETVRDLQSLEEEKTMTEQSLLANMDQARAVEARIADRTLRPKTELIKDEVDAKLKVELARVRSFIHDLRCNLEDIDTLQTSLQAAVEKMKCVATDITYVVHLDEVRIRDRTGTQPSSGAGAPSGGHDLEPICECQNDGFLKPILEANEEGDDYPFDF